MKLGYIFDVIISCPVKETALKGEGDIAQGQTSIGEGRGTCKAVGRTIARTRHLDDMKHS